MVSSRVCLAIAMGAWILFTLLAFLTIALFKLRSANHGPSSPGPPCDSIIGNVLPDDLPAEAIRRYSLSLVSVVFPYHLCDGLKNSLA